MTNLKNLQQEFQSYLLDPKSEIDFIHQITAKSSHAIEKLTVYSHAYRARLHEALAANYPILKQYTGDDLFDDIAMKYISQHYSKHYSIRWYGDQLAEFIQHEIAYEHMPYLSELAKLDWLMALVFDAKDAKYISIEKLATIAPNEWGNMILSFHPSTRLQTFYWDVVTSWRSLIENAEFSSIKKKRRTATYLLWRKNFTIQYKTLDSVELTALELAINGANFADICEALYDLIDAESVPMKAASLLKEWINLGLVVKISLSKGDQK